MANRFALVALLAFAGLAFGTASSASAQQFRSTCPLGAEQFGGRCNHGYYTPPRVYQEQRRVIYYVQPQQLYVVVDQQPEGYVVRRHSESNGAALVFGLAAAILGAIAANH
jgi:hypothetical protein